jgi:RNA polymerase sigma-70 factor (ECF subfamily)
MVYRRALFLLGNHADAEDATQEVFLKALTNAEYFEHRSQVHTWLSRITTNHCLNYIRNQSRQANLRERNLPDHTQTSLAAKKKGRWHGRHHLS